MTHKNRKKLRDFLFRSAGCTLLRAEGFFCSLDVLNGGLGLVFDPKYCFQLYIFFQFLVVKTLDPDRCSA